MYEFFIIVLCDPPKKYRKLGNSWLRKPRRGFRPPTFNVRFSISDFRLPTLDFQFPTPDLNLPTSDVRLPTSYFTIGSISAARVRSYCKDQSKCTIFEPTNGTRDWLRSHASTIPLYSNWWEYTRTSMWDHFSRRKSPPPIGNHQSKTPKFSQSKPYSWNLSKKTTSCERPQPFLRMMVLEIYIAFNPALLSDWPSDTIFWSLCSRYHKSYYAWLRVREELLETTWIQISCYTFSQKKVDVAGLLLVKDEN